MKRTFPIRFGEMIRKIIPESNERGTEIQAAVLMSTADQALEDYLQNSLNNNAQLVVCSNVDMPIN